MVSPIPTKAKIRNVMSVLFNHALRYELLEMNPITLVRQSAQRKSIPPVLEPGSVSIGSTRSVSTGSTRQPFSSDDLWLWKETTGYSDSDDWVFASPRTRGKRPLRPDGVLSKIIRLAAVGEGIKKRIGWHTFRHTYSSTLIANGENVKVVQELMRHASSRFTLEVYTQAKAKAKREAQQRIVEMMLPEEGLAEIRLQRREPPEMLGADEK